MAYDPTHWEDAPSSLTPITAARLNKLERGIFDAHAEITALRVTLKTLDDTLKSVLSLQNAPEPPDEEFEEGSE